MDESLYPPDDIWDKFDLPRVELCLELLSAVDCTMELPQVVPIDCILEQPQVVPSHVMDGRHDPMWAGICASGMFRKACVIAEPVVPEPVVAVTVTVRSVKSSRSILRTTRTKTSATSHRPETPSESEEDESPVCGVACDNEDLSVSVSVSEVTGQVIRTRSELKTPSPPSSPVPAFYTDHSYHINKSAVTLDNLGVQTPSDSEEEIDVVSVADRDKLTTLPTNPSARDRQRLQRTVASAIQQRASRGHKRSAPDDVKRSYKRRRAPEDGEDSSERRHLHNDMERKRRIDMRDAISKLRKLVPAVADNKRAAKVLILNEAATYCQRLSAVDERLSRLNAELFRRQKELSSRLRELRVENAKLRGSVEKSPRKKRMGSRSGISTHQRRQAATQRMLAACRKKQILECRMKQKLALEHRENQRFCLKPR